MSLDELKLPKNNLFKLTCRDGHDNPNYTFTWELTPEGAATLREKNVRFPFMYVLAVREIPPKKVETHGESCGCDFCAGYNKIVDDALFCLHEGAGQIQFHRQGEFRIYAMIVWYDDSLMGTHTWKRHRCRVMEDLYMYQHIIVEEDVDSGWRSWSLPHVEEDSVHITASFFAKNPNPTLWWWANLWYENKPRNSCDYKKRLWFAPGLLIQVPIVRIYALIRGVLMALSYVILLLVGFRPSSFSFRPMFHAFSSVFKQMCDFESRTCNWALQDSTGIDRKSVLAIAVRIPILWVVVPTLLYLCGTSIYHHPMAWIALTSFLVGTVALGFGLFVLTEKLKSRSNSVVSYYEQVPIEEPKKRRVTPKVRWLDAKGKYCLPFPE